MTRQTTGRKYRCDNEQCKKYLHTWIGPAESTSRCVCDETPTFIGYIEEDAP